MTWRAGTFEAVRFKLLIRQEAGKEAWTGSLLQSGS